MGRERERRGNSARRGRRSDPRLRGLSYEERQRVYRRRRIGAVLVIVAFLLVVIDPLGVVPLFGGSGTEKAAVENASRKAERPASADEDTGRESAEEASESLAKSTPNEHLEGAERVSLIRSKPLDVLVLGVDRRTDDTEVKGSRADTVMVARISPKTGEVKMLSIPRDLFVEIEPREEDRINAAYSYGGVEQMAETVERATGITVERYAIVDFRGFEDMVDAVGGLRIKIQGEMPPRRKMEGTMTLDGEQALFYARYRGTPGADLDRIARQQQLVAALRKKIISWASVSKLPGIIEAIQDNLQTDLGLKENLVLARSLLKAEDGAGFEAFQLKGVPTVLPDGRQVLMPDGAANEKTLEEFLSE